MSDISFLIIRMIFHAHMPKQNLGQSVTHTQSSRLVQVLMTVDECEIM